MKLVSIAFMALASWPCFAQPSDRPSNLQTSNAQIEAIKEQARTIGQANIDRQRATLPTELLTPKADPQQERQRLKALKAINSLRITNGQPALQ
jgi:hypothetical protein